MDSRRRRADPARPDDAGLGRHPRGREAVPAPADGGRRRLRRARRRPGRPADRRARRARLRRQHADLLHLGRQRLVGRGPERHDQRAAGAERHPDHGRAAHRGARGTRRPRRARLAEDRQPVPRRLGVGGQHAVQGHEAAGLPPRRHPQPDGVRWPAKIKPDPTPRTQFHHCNDVVPTIYEVVGITPPRVGERRPAGPDRRRQLRLHASTTATRRGPAAHAVLRDHGQPRDLPRRLDGLARSGPRIPGCPGCPPASATGARTTTSGSSTTWTRTGPRPTTSPPQHAREAGADEGTVRDRGREEQRAPDRRRAVGRRAATPSSASPRRTRVGVRRRHDPDARVLRSGAGQQAQRGHHRRSTCPDNAERRAVPAGRQQPADSRASSTTATSATSTTCSSSAHQDPLDRAAPAGHAQDRGRDRVRRAAARRPAERSSSSVDGRSSRTGRCRSARRCCSPPTTASTSAPASARRCRSTTTTGRRSRSTARSTRCM